MMPDKSDECGGHKGCTMDDHDCDMPCEWPDCLTEDEHAELLAELSREAC